MIKIFPKTLALLILICSCNANKSFLHQRYTHFKHKKTTVVIENNSYTEKRSKTAVVAPQTVAINSGSVQAERLEYTKAVVSRVVLPIVAKGNEKNAGLICSSSKLPITKLTKIKPVKSVQKHEKRGLLWGVIDGILAIIVLAVFVALVVWLLLLYNVPPR